MSEPDKTNIKVLHVVGRLDIGGAEMRTVELMPIMSKMGVHFNFCTLLAGDGRLDENVQKLNGRVYPCPLRPDILNFGRRFISVLKSAQCDIVHSHVHLFSGNIVRLAQKAAVKGRIVHFRSMGDGKRRTIKRRAYHRIMRSMVNKHATAILAVGNGTMEYAWGTNWKSDSRCRVIHNGFNLEQFETPADRKGVRNEFKIPTDSKIVIYVARFIPEKAHSLLLEAASEIVKNRPDTHFLLVGDGVLKPKMEAKAAEMNLQNHVHFLGTRVDVPRLLKASDCFVLPSFREGLPGVVLEAAVAGLPIVATDLPGVREIAEYTDLIKIIPLGDKTALVREIHGAISQEVDCAIKQNFKDEFGIDNCARQLYKLYTNQIDSKESSFIQE